MERGFDGDRRRRFDAHELYLLSHRVRRADRLLLHPAARQRRRVSPTPHRPVTELYASLLGTEHQLAPLDERLAEIRINNPDETDPVLAAVFGSAEEGARNWHESFRTWRKTRLREVEREYGDRLDEVAAFLQRRSPPGSKPSDPAATSNRCPTAKAKKSCPTTSDPPTDEELLAHLERGSGTAKA